VAIVPAHTVPSTSPWRPMPSACQLIAWRCVALLCTAGGLLLLRADIAFKRPLLMPRACSPPARDVHVIGYVPAYALPRTLTPTLTLTLTLTPTLNARARRANDRLRACVCATPNPHPNPPSPQP
jgi:hypothetical protein